MRTAGIANSAAQPAGQAPADTSRRGGRAERDPGGRAGRLVRRDPVEPARRGVGPQGCRLRYAELSTSGPVTDSSAPPPEWPAGRLDQPMSVAQMAVRPQVSAPTPTRRFTEQLGISPGRRLPEETDARGDHRAQRRPVLTTEDNAARRGAGPRERPA
ncbi:hypothetical protein [Streptomyces sp. NPDC059552]|uniref:hypothetical protein n=1 Tax=Streptomyces sp. NPDC059552 TaxID=3346862 RepID=UPI0036AA8ABF